MNREIKYRVWDRKKKKMLRLGICVGYGVNGLYILDADDRVDGSVEPKWIFEREITDNRKEDEFAVMQYTGLKDKNGKEIYEGDILSCPFVKDEVTHNTGIDVVIFDDSSYVCCGMSLGGQTRYCNIIGNIYENPELLKDKK